MLQKSMTTIRPSIISIDRGQWLLLLLMMIDRAKRPDAIQEIRPGIVDRHARVVCILSPTLGGRWPQVIPDLMLLRLLVDPDMACIVHRLKFGPLIRRRPITKRVPCHRQIQVFPILGFTCQMRREWLSAGSQRSKVALTDNEHPSVRQFNGIAGESRVSQSTCGQGEKKKNQTFTESRQ